MEWCQYASAGLRAHALIAGICEDLEAQAVGQELGQSQLSGLGDVGAIAGPDRAAEQYAPLDVREDQAFTAFCLVLPETKLSRSVRPAAGRRTRTSVPSMMPLPLAPKYSMTSARVRSRIPRATVQPRCASTGRTSPTARVMVERSTPNQQASTS